MKWVAVEVIGVFIPGKLISKRAESNGNNPGSHKYVFVSETTDFHTHHVYSNAIFGMKWVAVRVFGASIAGKSISGRAKSNGNSPGTRKSIYFY